MIVIKGIAASPGIAIGKAYVVEDEDIVVERIEIERDLIKGEVRRFKQAQKATLRDLDAAEQKVLKVLGKQHAKLIDAHRLILKDTLITQDVSKRIVDEGVNAEFALSEALEQVNRQFEKMDDEFFRERRHDLFDVGKRLLLHLMRRQKRSLTEVNHECVLIVRNLLPSDALGLKETKILGFATDLGGKTSHTAILAQSLEIPAVVGLTDVSRRVKTGDVIVLDGEQGMVIINPSPETVAKYEKVRQRAEAAERSLDALRGVPAVTQDGRAFRLEANLDAPDELKHIVSLQTDGIGLFRTEYLFLNRTEPPSEEEQAKAYGAVAKALGGREVVIRTADIGGDRLSQIGIEGPKSETNPFMGLRGVRLFLRHLDLFKIQLRAIVRASLKGKVRVMIPMVSSVGEVVATRKLLAQAQAELAAEGVPFDEGLELGIMVEIPSVAIHLEAFLPHVDFISIGTNDLIQYTLAVDRINEHVTHLYDPYHPAVVRLLDSIVQTAHKKGTWVGVCGEMTSDPRAVPLLVGLGVDAMSISPRMFLRVKQAIRDLRYESLKRLVAKAVACSESDEVRRLLEQNQ